MKYIFNHSILNIHWASGSLMIPIIENKKGKPNFFKMFIILLLAIIKLKKSNNHWTNYNY